MNTHVKEAIVKHADAVPHEEVCGFVCQVDHDVFALPCANVSPEPRDTTFEIDPQDYIRARGIGRVCGIYHGGHTHTNDDFSEEDRATAREMCLPLHLLSAAGKWATYTPDTYAYDLLERPWAWGESDCYALVRDYFRQKRGLAMGDYDRDETFERAKESEIVKHIAAEGFSYIDQNAPILVEDVLLLRTVGSIYPHHLAIVVGSNRMLHHPWKALSRIEDIDGSWLKRIVGVLRYTGGRA